MREIDMAFILKIGFIWSEVAICVIGFVWSEVAICVLKPLFILIKFETEIKTRFELSALQRKTNLNYAKIVLLLQMSQLFWKSYFQWQDSFIIRLTQIFWFSLIFCMNEFRIFCKNDLVLGFSILIIILVLLS